MLTRPRRPSASQPPAETNTLTELWILRLLVPLGGHKDFVGRMGFSNTVVAHGLGLGRWVDPEEDDYDQARMQALLRKRHRAAEERAGAAVAPAPLRENVARLAALVGMNEADCRLLEFATMIHHQQVLDDAGDTIGQLCSTRLMQVLAVVLGLPEASVRASLAPSGVLARSGLLAVDRPGLRSLRFKLDLLSDKFADHIVAASADPIALLRDTVSASTPAQLTLADYGHLEQALAILLPYLKQTLLSGREGVNIFLHGAPGTGKSELARALAAALGSELFEVASEDSDGDPVNGERRLRAYRAAQSFFCRRRALILFDEVEDVFDDGDSLFGRKSTAQRRKAWVNRTLEQNAVPALWLSNSISGIDPAIMRRFDMVIEVPVPPREQRERILRERCGDVLDARTLGRIADAETVAPAVVSRAADVVRSIDGQFDPPGAARAVAWLVDQSLEAQGHAPLRHADAARLPEQYDPALMRADADLAQVAAGLAATRSARLCLYGPPGTGKTAWGRWLAQQLDMPLMLRRASDLMSKWVGESEKNIASAFRQAEAAGALLMIDEVDSFLQERTNASHGWEVSMVNEMLTRIETFSGLFIASTNLMSGLDSAALRRFDLKVRFDFLLPAQAEALLARYAATLALAPAAPDAAARLRRLAMLTPGDFAAVARQHRFRPMACAGAFIAALEQECALKAPAGKAIGFLA